MRKEISANGMRRNQEDHFRSLYTRKFQPKEQNEEKMTWTTLLSLVAAKKHIFREVGLTQNLGSRLAEILTANHFHFFNNFLKRPILLTAIFLPVFYPTAIIIHSRFSSLKVAP